MRGIFHDEDSCGPWQIAGREGQQMLADSRAMQLGLSVLYDVELMSKEASHCLGFT